MEKYVPLKERFAAKDIPAYEENGPKITADPPTDTPVSGFLFQFLNIMENEGDDAAGQYLSDLSDNVADLSRKSPSPAERGN